MLALLLLALVLQVAAGLWALGLLRRAGFHSGWLFLALGLLLMAGRRVALLVSWVQAPAPFASSPHWWQEAILSSVISLLLLAGVVATGKFFSHLWQERQSLAAGHAQLANLRQRWEELLARLPVGVVVEKEGGIAFANVTFCRMLGLSAEKLQGQPLASFVYGEDQEKLGQAPEHSSDGLGSLELRLLRREGSPLWAAARRVRGFWQSELAEFWVFADITERKQREAERAATEALFSQGPVVLMRWRPAPARNVAFVSENIRAWGFDPQALMADPEAFYKWAHPEDRQRVQEEAQGYFAAGAESWSQSYRLVCPDGKVRWIFDRTVVLRDAAGQVLGFDGYLLDVTEAVETARQLAAERTRFGAALEATGQVTYDWDILSGHLAWNRNLQRAFGHSPESLAHIDQWAERIHPQDRQRVEQALAASLATGEPFEVEYRFQRANGSYAHVLDRGVVERDEKGQPVRMVGAMVDLSEVHKLQEQLALSQRLEALGQLAGGMAHDFNNLLTAILSTLDMAERKLTGEHPLREDLGAVRAAALRAAELVRSLLAFARRQVVELQPVDLNVCLQKTMDILRRLLPETIRLDFIPGRQLGTVMADPAQLDQVLVNLAVNARDAMPEGGVLTVETENVLINGEFVAKHPWAKEGRYVLLSVSDTGVGMDEVTRQRAFEPFFTTKEPGKGTGLGLSTVYGIVKQHQGLIHLYSEPGKGTTFKIYLPIVERRAVDVGPKVEGAVRGGKETILLVEDEEVVRNVLATSLAELGYQVFTAEDGQVAWELLQARNFAVDLVVSDVVMPRLGGWELYQKVHEAAPSVLFLFSTGYSENAVHTNFVKKEGVYLITKPYGLDSLARKVREILDLRAKEGKS
jgi:PAS domain S-box-containing protein